MKRFFGPVILATAISLQAASPPRGNDRLQELVVFPEIKLTFGLGIDFQGGELVINKYEDPAVGIARVREEMKRQPDNTRPLLQLGNLLEDNGDNSEAQDCYRKAEQLCRARITARPKDGLALTELGKSLWQLDKYEEAENAYRKAVLVSSNEWRCWDGLGNYLANHPFFMMFPEKLRNQFTIGPVPPPHEILDYRTTPKSFKKAEASLGEASRCFDVAMALAPKEPDVFFQHAGFICTSNWQSCFFRHSRNREEISASQWSLTFFSQETIANLQKAADLSPKDFGLNSLVAYFEWFRAALLAHWPSNNFTIDMLPEKTKQSIHSTMTRLEDLSEAPDKKAAAGALENLGFLNMTFQNVTEAKVDFRRAVALDPTREASWDLLLGAMLNSGASPEEIVSVCESRLKHQNSVRNYLLLAKALTKEEKWDEAAVQAEIAGKLETNNIVPPLFIEAIALKKSAATNYLAAAKLCMKRADAIWQTIPTSDRKVEWWREFMLNGAILHALAGQPKMAKDWVDEVLKDYPNDETAKEILKALD
jgi:tetratricopeptide (TPR) repeat protein